MLADKLRAATAAAAVPIEYVGGYVEGFTGQSTDRIISLTSLTGGLASAPAAGDLVIVHFAVGRQADLALTVSGYTEVVELYSDDTYDTNLVVAYKHLSAADTSLTLTGGTTDSGAGGAVSVHVFRNVDPIFPLDVTSTTATGVNSALANPPSITPVTEGAWVVAGAGGGLVPPPTTYSSSYLSGFKTAFGDDSRAALVGVGYYEWTSGAFDPAQFTLGKPDSTNNSWAAVTLALRPVYTGPTPTFVGTQNAATSASTVTVNKPTGTTEGDLMIAFLNVGSSGSNGTWTPPSGWTEVSDYGTEPNLAVMRKTAGASEPSSYDFTCTSTYTAGRIVTYKNAAYDTIGTTAYSASATSITATAITPNNAGAVILSAFSAAGSGSSWTTPSGTSLIGLADGGTYTTAVFSSSDGSDKSSIYDTTAALSAVQVSIIHA